jgi:tetraprenyl-beta-curcumene synthase
MDTTPLRFRQVWALARAARRELLWGLPAVSREIDAWRRRAQAIPDASLREDAVGAIARKRAHADGAALFWTLPRRRHEGLLRLLVAYQTAWDFLDNVSERGACMGEHNGLQLHRALVDALDPRVLLSDYYSHHLCGGDGGYLRTLAGACREVCAALPSYECVRSLVLSEAQRCAIQSLNHNPDSRDRDGLLKQWAERELAAARIWERHEVSWFELTAATSASLVPHVLLSLAAEPACPVGDVVAAHAAYLPWASLATAMLDSYADRLEDEVAGEHSYIAHYRDGEEAVRRVAEIVARATREAGGLRGGPRHAVIVACMVAMYLSKDSVRGPARHSGTTELIRSGGSLTRLLLPVLRAWRIAYGQRAA